MKFNYPEIGICGLSCRLCPSHNSNAPSRCAGCKSEVRMAVGCTFIRCAVNKKGLEFCWDCDEHKTCEKWRKHREFSQNRDSFKCYQKLDDNIAFILKNGVKAFEKTQQQREKLLTEMLNEFNEGRSKSYFCIAATVMKIDELVTALKKARKKAQGLEIKARAKILHAILDEIAERNNYNLKLRK